MRVADVMTPDVYTTTPETRSGRSRAGWANTGSRECPFSETTAT